LKESDPPKAEAAGKVYNSVKILALGYWVPLLLIGLLANSTHDDDDEDEFGTGANWVLGSSILIFWGIQLVVWMISLVLSGLNFMDWYRKVFLYGARDLSIMVSNASITDHE
jgi:hypothetical protein